MPCLACFFPDSTNKPKNYIMSDTNSFPPPVPPHLPAQTPNTLNLPLGEGFEERLPVSGFINAVESILRQPRRIIYQLQMQGQGLLIARLLIIAMVCSIVYGLVVGTFSRGDQLFQFWTAPVKVSLGLLVSALLCLPSLYIFSCLSGSQARLVEVFGLLAGMVALTTVLLIGLAPVAWVFSESTKSVPTISVLHLAFWLVATWFGVRFLRTGFTHLKAASGAGLKVWLLIFLLVALQMTTALRPIIGTAPTFLPVEKKFFINHWLDCLEK